MLTSLVDDFLLIMAPSLRTKIIVKPFKNRSSFSNHQSDERIWLDDQAIDLEVDDHRWILMSNTSGRYDIECTNRDALGCFQTS